MSCSNAGLRGDAFRLCPPFQENSCICTAEESVTASESDFSHCFALAQGMSNHLGRFIY